ncbi:type II secretion system F family protein [Kineosporia sp. A_224]|uniref:type II secretion system F family protein n=1 Tax=Kineosporia sp. A_224 TaxID=1962180 RepID=UPI000B4BA964|nr:type II secretion system F family protein [Kineosporia sp. A_224]
MGVVVGLLLGAGLFLVWWSCWVPDDAGAADDAPPGSRGPSARLRETLLQAGIEAVSPAALVACCLGAAATAFLLAVGVSRSVVVGSAFALIAGWGPIGYVRARARRRRTVLRDLWPEVVDNLTSAVRAGLSLPEALGQLEERGPEQLREPFAAFARDYRASGRFGDSLDALKDRLCDPVADRICEALRVTREVGGSDLGRLLRSLSTFLREDARTRGELLARQTWTVNGARLAVAAPWLVLAMLSSRPQAVAAYDSATGAGVLAAGGAVCLGAYRLMLRLGRLPDEERVLR